MRKTPAAIALSTLCLVILAGCGTPPWREKPLTAAPNDSASPAGSSTASVPPTAGTASAQPSKTTPAVRNDLAKGSAKRSLEAGGVRMSINYWSALSMGDWTAAALKPLNMSASAVFIDGSKQDIFLAKVTVNIGVEGPDGPLKAPAALVDDASLTPGYLITSPSSYGQVFTIPAVPEGATSVSLALTYELLAQTAPKAKTFAKQTASDTLIIPIVP